MHAGAECSLWTYIRCSFPFLETTRHCPDRSATSESEGVWLPIVDRSDTRSLICINSSHWHMLLCRSIAGSIHRVVGGCCCCRLFALPQFYFAHFAQMLLPFPGQQLWIQAIQTLEILTPAPILSRIASLHVCVLLWISDIREHDRGRIRFINYWNIFKSDRWFSLVFHFLPFRGLCYAFM